MIDHWATGNRRLQLQVYDHRAEAADQRLDPHPFGSGEGHGDPLAGLLNELSGLELFAVLIKREVDGQRGAL